MPNKQAKDLKEGDKIKIFDDIYIVEKIEVSEVGSGKGAVGSGKAKARIDAINEKTKEKRIMIKLASDEIEVL